MLVLPWVLLCGQESFDHLSRFRRVWSANEIQVVDNVMVRCSRARRWQRRLMELRDPEHLLKRLNSLDSFFATNLLLKREFGVERAQITARWLSLLRLHDN